MYEDGWCEATTTARVPSCWMTFSECGITLYDEDDFGSNVFYRESAAAHLHP